jgi:hypothetical protein
MFWSRVDGSSYRFGIRAQFGVCELVKFCDDTLLLLFEFFLLLL